MNEHLPTILILQQHIEVLNSRIEALQDRCKHYRKILLNADSEIDMLKQELEQHKTNRSRVT